MQRVTRIALLTGLDDGPVLTQLLHAQNPALDVAVVPDRESLDRFAGTPLDGTRLIAVCSPVIVPRDVLERLPGPAYNFHPGPPHRPGRYPTVFALYDDDAHFGVTVHEMAAKVDSGPIVAVEHFDLHAGCGLAALETLTVQRVITLFARLAPHLALHPEPLPHLDVTWTGTKTTLAQARALGRLTPTMSPEEVARRTRACGGLVVQTEDPGWIEA